MTEPVFEPYAPPPALNGEDKIVRLEINISEVTAKTLADLKERKGISVTDAVHRAVRVYDYLLDELYCAKCKHAKGCRHVRKHLRIEDKKKKVTTDITILA